MTCTNRANSKRRNSDTRVFTNASINNLFNTAFGEIANTRFPGNYGFPATNVQKHKNKFILELAIPGFAKNDISIQAEKEILTVSGHKEGTDKKDNFRLKEFGTTNFTKSFKLPKNIDVENINAKLDQGVLEITLNTKELESDKSIEINIH